MKTLNKILAGMGIAGLLLTGCAGVKHQVKHEPVKYFTQVELMLQEVDVMHKYADNLHQYDEVVKNDKLTVEKKMSKMNALDNQARDLEKQWTKLNEIITNYNK